MDPRSDNIQSVMYLESAAGSGGILAGGGPFFGGSCRLSGVSLSYKDRVSALNYHTYM